jgi:cysteine synthase
MAGTAGVYQMSDLKVAAQGKSKKDLVLDDLLATPRNDAATKTYKAIVDGTSVTLLGPATNVGIAFALIAKEREAKGI